MAHRKPLMFRAIFGAIIAIWVLMVAGIIGAAWATWNAGPEGIGRVVGSIARGFHEANR